MCISGTEPAPVDPEGAKIDEPFQSATKRYKTGLTYPLSSV